ncbi:MAG: glycosyltransferase family 39 protein [Acidobacteriaceae bacterium]
MQLIRRYRLPAFFCALSVLICELISRPYTTMGVCDDGPYILMARTLAATGHVVYNGWTVAMLLAQIYLAAAFFKLFGSSFTTARMSTLLVAVVLAWLLQRTLVRASISERNATIGTLALVLSPLYLLLSVTFMSDIYGLFAIVICLYGCLRALQASTDRATIAWFCFAVATNVLCGTSRQTAWFGTLVMVPSTLWLLRAQRRVLLSSAAITLAGALVIFACMHWLSRQPYIITVTMLTKPTVTIATALAKLIHAGLDVPFLLLPIIVLFLPKIRRIRPVILGAIAIILFISLLVLSLKHLHLGNWLEPTTGDWVTMHGMIIESGVKGYAPVSLNLPLRLLLTIASFGGLLGLSVSWMNLRRISPSEQPTPVVSQRQLAILIIPFSVAYIVSLFPLAGTLGLSDRYLIGLLAVALFLLLRYYQDYIRPQVPLVTLVVVAIMAIYGISCTHNTFAYYRARVALAAELHSAGVSDISVDNGWEYNFGIELQHATHINESRIKIPANAYVPTPDRSSDNCPMALQDDTPHIHPLYSVSFEPNLCYGAAPFAPVHFSRWPFSKPGTLYVVHSIPPTKP